MKRTFFSFVVIMSVVVWGNARATAAPNSERFGFCSYKLSNTLWISPSFAYSLRDDEVNHQFLLYHMRMGYGDICHLFNSREQAEDQRKTQLASIPGDHIFAFKTLEWKPSGSRYLKDDILASKSVPNSEREKVAVHSKIPKSVPQAGVSDGGPIGQKTAVKGPTPNQIKYQRELEGYKARLAEIEQMKAAAETKLANDKAAARQIIDRHRQEMEVSRQQTAAADRARRAYELELAAHEARAKQMRTKQDRDALADWPEAVAVCELNSQNAQAKFGNWRCEGPLQMDYAKLGSGGSVDATALFNVSNACGGKVESVRDLGLVSGYRVFGCSYGMHPNQAQRLSNDAAAKFGLGYIPGRITYRCPKWQSGCRVR